MLGPASLIITGQMSSAPLQDLGSSTLDPNTGLMWLDVDATSGLSYNDVQATLLGPAQRHAGYRYATVAEVRTLLANAGVTEPAPRGPNDKIKALVSLLGPTSVGPGLAIVRGLTADEPPSDNSSVIMMLLISGNETVDSFAGPSGVVPKSRPLPADFAGSFLVREARNPAR